MSARTADADPMARRGADPPCHGVDADPIAIQLVITARHYGGAERQLLYLAAGLAARGHRVGVISWFANPLFERDCRELGLVHRPLGVRSTRDLPRALLRFLRLVRRSRPSVLHGYLTTANLTCVLARLVSPATRTVWGILTTDFTSVPHGRLSAAAEWVQRRVSRLADLVIVCSVAGAEEALVRGYPRGRVHAIECGIDCIHFRPDSEAGRHKRAEWGVAPDEPLVGLVARVVPEKDHLTFLSAAAELARRRPAVRFVCLGMEPLPDYADSIRRRASRLGLDGRVIWADLTSDMRGAYNAFDTLTLTSKAGEGVPNAVGEAMACGVPCVVTDIGDSSRLVGNTGVTVRPRDSEALVRAWTTILSRPSPLSADPRARIEQNYGLARMVNRTEALLMSLSQAETSRGASRS